MRLSSALLVCVVVLCLILGASLSTSFAKVSTIDATVSIHPDTLNCRHASAEKAGGRWITVYIELPEDYDVAYINVSSVLLDGVIPAESDSKYGFVKSPEMEDRNSNGVTELMVKFDRHAVASHVLARLAHTMPIPKRGVEIDLTITGGMMDGTAFEGIDTIRAVYPE